MNVKSVCCGEWLNVISMYLFSQRSGVSGQLKSTVFLFITYHVYYARDIGCRNFQAVHIC